MNLTYRSANLDDLASLVFLLADDELGSQREDASMPLNESYTSAFNAISADPNNQLLVVESQGALIGMMQMTYIPYLTHIGSWRCLIEGVRIDKAFRGQGLGEIMFEYAIYQAKVRGCSVIQLTSDKLRPDALRFYEKLGFKATHEGFKLLLPQ
ncbi:GNAT family N-acetyltransferase [Vibrio tetraodonis]|uniref:GNAT family N-acetyltransferase n=1 Tax=Vibrio tetraodonis TaxID=2231647 RepID=UPI000E0BF812|nr:GNAT family N-acetyltransferase [Vibrio tetraodonis]